MPFDWQDVLVTLLLLAAGSYVVLRVWKVVAGKKQSGSCGGCGTCSSNKSAVGAAPKAVLQIDPPGRS